MANMPGVQDEDDTAGKPIFLMRPADHVYSYFMFIGPTESKRGELRSAAQQNEINWDVVMGYVLVILNFFMQTVLLYLIFHEVVISNVHWQNGILKLGGKANPMALLTDGSASKCNDGNSLCFRDTSGLYSCAPPSVQLTGRWDELDTNKDGIWTREEVIAEADMLQCKYFVNPLEVFDVLINMLKERASPETTGINIWLHPDVAAGKAIHLPYFTYVMSDVIMCGYRSADMCANLLQRGFFHAPMKYGTAPRVGNTIDSALKYCNELLAPGGLCERNLPSTYAVWKVTSGAECGEPEYGQFQYTNPGNNVTKKSLLMVDYSQRAEYELAQDFMFRVFKAILIFTWLLLMTCEYRDVFKVLTFCARMPNADEMGDDAVIMESDPSDPEHVRYRILGITTSHRRMIIFLCFIRVLVTCVLCVVGVAYLIKTNDYADLIMNGVALVFISEISKVLYAQVLREEVKEQTEDIKAIKVRMYGWEWLNDRPALIDILCVTTVWVVVYFIMSWQMTTVVVPVHDALECTCLVQGSHCAEAKMYNFDFWHEYWLNGVPGALKEMAILQASTPSAAPSLAPFVAVGASPAAATSLLARNMSLHQAQLEAKIEILTEKIGKLEVLEGMAPAAPTPAAPLAKGVAPAAPTLAVPAAPPAKGQRKQSRGQAGGRLQPAKVAKVAMEAAKQSPRKA